jgi:hypothetical protein
VVAPDPGPAHPLAIRASVDSEGSDEGAPRVSIRRCGERRDVDGGTREAYGTTAGVTDDLRIRERDAEGSSEVVCERIHDDDQTLSILPDLREVTIQLHLAFGRSNARWACA